MEKTVVKNTYADRFIYHMGMNNKRRIALTFLPEFIEKYDAHMKDKQDKTMCVRGRDYDDNEGTLTISWTQSKKNPLYSDFTYSWE